jgi:hypothetical protein
MLPARNRGFAGMSGVGKLSGSFCHGMSCTGLSVFAGSSGAASWCICVRAEVVSAGRFYSRRALSVLFGAGRPSLNTAPVHVVKRAVLFSSAEGVKMRAWFIAG